MPTTTTSAIGSSFRSALTKYLRAYGTPDHARDVDDQAFRIARYEILSSLASGTAYDDKTLWGRYNAENGLYRSIRQLWDQAGPLIDFYAYRVWSGSIPDDGLRLPEGFVNMVPFAVDTDPALAAAAAALLQDWNFEDRAEVLVRSVATLGEMLVEVRDRPEKGRLDLDFVWPGYVVDIELSSAGHVEYFAIQYRVRQERKRANGSVAEVEEYTYRREVSKEDFRTYKDGTPFGYDPAYPAVVENPWKFVPAVWFRHHRTLGVRGESAIAGTMGVTDEINSLASHLLDKTHVNLQAPVVISGNLSMGALYRAVGGAAKTMSRKITSALVNKNDVQQEQDILEAPAGTRVETIDVNLDSAVKVGDFLQAGAEKRVPETTVFTQLRKMTQITGPAAEVLFGDVEPKNRTIVSSYDRSLVDLIVPGIAIGGWRVNRGDWDGTRAVDDEGNPIGGLTERQERFRSFSLGSYGQGKLSLVVVPRKLFPSTQADILKNIETKARVMPFIPGDQLAHEAGYDRVDAQQWIKDHEAKQREEQARAIEVAKASRPEPSVPPRPPRE